MIDQQHLDIRTITMGISLLSCCDPDPKRACEKIYEKITRYAENLVKTGAGRTVAVVEKNISKCLRRLKSITPRAKKNKNVYKNPTITHTVFHTGRCQGGRKKEACRMVGFLIAVLSGVLMSVQGIFNTQVTKASSIWSANVFVQATALLSCLAVWLAADRLSERMAVILYIYRNQKERVLAVQKRLNDK